MRGPSERIFPDHKQSFFQKELSLSHFAPNGVRGSGDSHLEPSRFQDRLSKEEI